MQREVLYGVVNSRLLKMSCSQQIFCDQTHECDVDFLAFRFVATGVAEGRHNTM